MIYKTIGVGGDFADYETAITPIDGVPLLDDYIFDQISSFVQAISPAGRRIILNGHTVKFTCSHNEANPNNWQNWYKVFLSNIDNFAIFWNGNNAISGTFIYDHFYLETTPGTNYATAVLGIAMQANIGFYTFVDCYNGYIDCQDRSFSGINIGNNSWSRQAHKYRNLKIWDFSNSGMISDYTPFAGIAVVPVIENVTIYSNHIGTARGIWCGSSPLIGKNIVVVNDIVGGGGMVDFVDDNPGGGYGPSDFQNCACTDTSLTDEFPAESSNSQENIVPADEFISLDDTNADFLKLGGHGVFDVDGVANPERGKAPLEVQFTDKTVYGLEGAGVLADGGTAPTLTDTDIEGLDVPNIMGQYSIGCHQIPAE